MTPPQRRRSRERRLAIAGDFPDTGESVTDVIERVRPASYDDRAHRWEGASGAGLPCTSPAPQPAPAARRQPDCAIWAILPGGGFGLLCGIDRWRRHADPETAHARHQFNALRESALAAGWRPDAFGRWCCPRCKTDPHYRTPQPVAHYHPDAAGGRGLMLTGHEGLRDAQFWLQVMAEHEVLRRTADGASHGRHHRDGAR